MSSNKQNRTASTNYRKPPVEHQFKKGTSGNPKGRPRKKNAAPPGFGALGTADRLAAMALDEAGRPVAVREGDKVSEIPAMRALLRTMYRAAAQGDTKAGRQLLELIARAESARTENALGLLQYSAQYKEKYAPIFDKHEHEGLDPPDIYPHPDDIIINEATGEVTLDGPTDKEGAGARMLGQREHVRGNGEVGQVEHPAGLAIAHVGKDRIEHRVTMADFGIHVELPEITRLLIVAICLFMVLLAAFKVLLLRYTGQADLVVGAPMANRNRAEIEGLIGFFVNMLVLRTDLSGNPSFREVLRRVKDVTLGAYDHADMPFERLVEELQPDRSLSRNPIFQVVFALQTASVLPPRTAASPATTPASEIRPGNANTAVTGIGTAKFDLVLAMGEMDSGLVGAFEYSTDLFELKTVHQMQRHFADILRGIAEDQEIRVLDIPLRTSTENLSRKSIRCNQGDERERFYL